jgi:hypothetical protein
LVPRYPNLEFAATYSSSLLDDTAKLQKKSVPRTKSEFSAEIFSVVFREITLGTNYNRVSFFFGVLPYDLVLAQTGAACHSTLQSGLTYVSRITVHGKQKR